MEQTFYKRAKSEQIFMEKPLLTYLGVDTVLRIVDSDGVTVGVVHGDAPSWRFPLSGHHGRFTCLAIYSLDKKSVKRQLQDLKYVTRLAATLILRTNVWWSVPYLIQTCMVRTSTSNWVMKIVLGTGVWLLEAPKMPGTASVQDVYIFEVSFAEWNRKCTAQLLFLLLNGKANVEMQSCA